MHGYAAVRAGAACEARGRFFEHVTDFHAGVMRLYGEKSVRDKTTNGSPKEREGDGFFVLWVVIGIVLLILSFYLWYVVKKRQLVSEQGEGLRAGLGSLFDQAPCGYHAVDDDGYFAVINETLSRWLGYEKEELVGKVKFTDIVEDQYLAVVEGFFASGKGRADIVARTKDGSALPLELGLLRMPGRDGMPSRILYTSLDNSRCHDALERIKHLDHELEAFSYSISHDLRAPLRSIDGYSRILQEDYAGNLDEEGRRVLNVIMNNARRMGKLIDDLLEFGRLGRKTIQRSRVDMTGMVNHMVQELVSKEPTRKIDVHVSDLHAALADADMMRQVWLNLLENAVKYTGKRDAAIIEVRSYQTGKGEICYEVKDNGEGFDMKYVGKLFGVFQRLHKIQDFAGTGVGLAIVKRIISRHGGRVWAEGALHAGAVFYFTIPTEDENT